ncbi:MAG: peptidoglycan DD-metalloendopeptidase family protein [Candidatus Spechtbacteria bacterium]|nr:peptidoglycan DD-metalloendopeptidase family protein [Candidatus Spechtbacteria bacterium]
MRMRFVFYTFLFLSMFSIGTPRAFAGEVDDLKNQIDARQKEIQNLKEKEKEYKGAISEKRQKAATLADVVLDFNAKIQKTEKDISEKQKEITISSLRIRQIELEVDEKGEAIARMHAYIGSALREIYENDGIESVELFLKYKNLSDFFNQVEYRQILQQDFEFRVEALKSFRQKLEEQKIELTKEKDALKVLKSELEKRNMILEDEREEKRSLLTQTRNEEWRFKEVLKDVTAKQEEIQREIFNLEQKLREAIDASKLPIAAPGILHWPVEGNLTQGYGCTKFAKTSKAYPTCFHNGIDIAGSYGTPVKAARQGKILGVEKAPYAYGKWITIEHDNGLVTLYAHLSLQGVKPGQEVESGDIIGYMGSTGFSTGSHLHFTVYAPNSFATKPSLLSGTLPIGASLNPLDYLP